MLDNHKIYGYRGLLYDYCSFINFATSDIPQPSSIWNILEYASESNQTLTFLAKNDKILSFITNPDQTLSKDIELKTYYKLLNKFGISFWSIFLNGVYKNTPVRGIYDILNESEKLDVPVIKVLNFLKTEITIGHVKVKNNITSNIFWLDEDLIAIGNVFKRAQPILSLEKRFKYLSIYLEFIKQTVHSMPLKMMSPWDALNDWLPEYKERIKSLKALAMLTTGTYIINTNLIDADKFYEHVNLIAQGLDSIIDPYEQFNILIE